MQGLHTFLTLCVLICLGQNGHWSQIIDGDIVPENLMQYMVSLWNSEGHVCGGFLVSEKLVVTAAHCDDKKPSVVYVGYHNQQEFKEYHYFYKYKPKTYKNVTMGNDIMLLKLYPKVELGSKVKTIQLPASNENIRANEQCLVAGWGKAEPGGELVNELRMVKVNVIGPQHCKKIWHGLPDNVICSGGYRTKKQYCEGFSGGPLVCNGKAVGVVSVNKNCSDPDSPKVYTNISKYLPWIHRIMKQP